MFITKLAAVAESSRKKVSGLRFAIQFVGPDVEGRIAHSHGYCITTVSLVMLGWEFLWRPEKQGTRYVHVGAAVAIRSPQFDRCGMLRPHRTHQDASSMGADSCTKNLWEAHRNSES